MTMNSYIDNEKMPDYLLRKINELKVGTQFTLSELFDNQFANENIRVLGIEFLEMVSNHNTFQNVKCICNVNIAKYLKTEKMKPFEHLDIHKTKEN